MYQSFAKSTATTTTKWKQAINFAKTKTLEATTTKLRNRHTYAAFFLATWNLEITTRNNGFRCFYGKCLCMHVYECVSVCGFFVANDSVLHDTIRCEVLMFLLPFPFPTGLLSGPLLCPGIVQSKGMAKLLVKTINSYELESKQEQPNTEQLAKVKTWNQPAKYLRPKEKLNVWMERERERMVGKLGSMLVINKMFTIHICLGSIRPHCHTHIHATQVVLPLHSQFD